MRMAKHVEVQKDGATSIMKLDCLAFRLPRRIRSHDIRGLYQ